MKRPGNAATAAPAPAQLRKRSVVLHGHETSVSLEDAFWQALKKIAADDGVPVAQLIAAIDATRSGNLSSALRVYVLEKLRREPDSH